MEAYANYRNQVANAILNCHQQQDRSAEALRWAILARGKYPYHFRLEGKASIARIRYLPYHATDS